MILINNTNWELDTIGKTPEIGYDYEYITKTAISGKIHRIYKGRRIYANISYATLTPTQAQNLLSLIDSNVTVKIRTPFDIFEGAAQIKITKMPSRFDKSNTADTWTEWKISIVGVDYV